MLSRIALFNYMDDVGAPGTANLNVQIRVPNGGPRQVYVKYLASDSVSSRNITWAGQASVLHPIIPTSSLTVCI